MDEQPDPGSRIAAAPAQCPWILVDQLTIDAAAGARTTLIGLLVVVTLALVFVLPPLVYLLKLSQAPAMKAIAEKSSNDGIAR